MVETIRNPDPRPTSCSVCGSDMKHIGNRTSEPWPEDEQLYTVEKYLCSNVNCPEREKVAEYWPIVEK